MNDMAGSTHRHGVPLLSPCAAPRRCASGLRCAAIDLTAVGFGVVGLLAVTWIVAVLVWRFARPQVSALGAGGVTR
ncbi:hypothetical protein F8O01_13410 [Pseudoclavibacter chungangensis]|uniref:Uncharacterized protein n=1 Tax=Pseudoclavibacter chungangensis TaxID=587635 RepID=A0A7J5BPA2_9MICO|nr:hypothetical protein [Pseudoclavibacter chungangensis]KAB1654548.1 hypothetical protein F8O01_13410 [Pseudoclavibacter chungangensis]NYJ68219.1 hypothetical protein [Pseudoclavibacter chungangensis]